MTEKVEQVQIQIWGEDGKLFTPHQSHAALAAVRAISEDIQHYSGSYTDENLRQLRKALRELDSVITQRVGPEMLRDA